MTARANLRSVFASVKPGRRMAALHRPEAELDSEVSNWLITRFSEAQARWFLLAVLFGLWVVERKTSRRTAG